MTVKHVRLSRRASSYFGWTEVPEPWEPSEGAGDDAGSGGAGGGRGRGVREAAAGAASPPPVAPSRPAAGHTEVIERGFFSERHAERLPRETARVRLGREVRMTPLARDRLRRRGIAIERTER